MEAMLFQVTAEDHIRVMNENGRADGNPSENTFASEKEWEELANDWPMKRLVEIWNGLPGVEPVARFTDRKTAVRRIWRAVQPQAGQPAKPARGGPKSGPRPVFRDGSKAAQVCTLLSRPQGATLNEIRSETGWQAHTVRGFISRNLSKPGRKVRSFERAGERVYRLKV
jgi:Protein of unknown function (DUF3489)